MLAWLVDSWYSDVNEVQGFILRSHLESIGRCCVTGETSIKEGDR